MQGVPTEAVRALEPGAHSAVPGGDRHAGPQLLAGCQGAHQSLQELVPWSHVPG